MAVLVSGIGWRKRESSSTKTEVKAVKASLDARKGRL